MKAPIVTVSRRLRYGFVAVAAAAICAAALSACGGSASTGNGELTQARRATAAHIHREDRLRRLEARLRQVNGAGKSHTVPIPSYVPSAAPTTSTGTYYTPAPTPAPAPSPTGGSCGGELSVNANTSCPFAENVEQAYYAEVGSGPGEVVAYSPVTNRTYVMSCSGSPHECTGGDDAAVFFS
jgi:hypothetical protein